MMFAFIYIYIYTVHSYFVPCSKFYATSNPWNHRKARPLGFLRRCGARAFLGDPIGGAQSPVGEQ